mmetsp:Transcript_15896/g.43926  ORF Transcript_15896/g.43926 Transcript_15896/m.43926 type:complete len:252 (+) Transcript_15896:1482-2237(+)
MGALLDECSAVSRKCGMVGVSELHEDGFAYIVAAELLDDDVTPTAEHTQKSKGHDDSMERVPAFLDWNPLLVDKLASIPDRLLKESLQPELEEDVVNLGDEGQRGEVEKDLDDGAAADDEDEDDGKECRSDQELRNVGNHPRGERRIRKPVCDAGIISRVQHLDGLLEIVLDGHRENERQPLCSADGADHIFWHLQRILLVVHVDEIDESERDHGGLEHENDGREGEAVAIERGEEHDAVQIVRQFFQFDD